MTEAPSSSGCNHSITYRVFQSTFFTHWFSYVYGDVVMLYLQPFSHLRSMLPRHIADIFTLLSCSFNSS